MVQENILPIVDKLVNAKVTLDELHEILPLLDTFEFQETFKLIENIETAVKPIGRAELRKELQLASEDYRKEVKVVNFNSINRWSLVAVAASVLIICSTIVFNSVTNYNNVNHFRKSYVENLK